MAGSMNVKKISKSQKLFRLSLWILVLVVLLFVGVLLLNLTQAAKIKHLENKIAKKEAQLEKDESSDGYKKFLAVKSLESKTSWMFRYERIEKISEILDDLRNIDGEDWESTIELSDFNVSLEELSLRGVVSSLKDLYYTNASWRIKAVLDRFESLDFIEKMTIKEYQKIDEWFEFVLYANVINNDWK